MNLPIALPALVSKHVVKRFVPFAALVVCAAPLAAQSPYLGQYSGPILIGFSGSVNQPPTSAGGLIFNVLTDGTVSELSGDPIGTVTTGGAITWQQPNRFNFTTGTISGGSLTSSSSTTSGGLTTTYSITANVQGGAFLAGQTLTGRLLDLATENGYTDHNAIQYTGDRFIAVGKSGTVALSEDGKKWTRSAAPTARDLNAVTYGNGTYVAGGVNGALFTSPDAVTWTQRTSPFSTLPITGLAYGAGRFVMTSSSGGTAHSTDGIAWTLVSTGTGTNVFFLNSKFVLSSNFGSALYLSDDGISFPTSTSTTAGNVRSVTYGNGTWLAAGTSGISRSTDLTTWIATHPLSSGLPANTALVGFGNNRFVARTAGSTGVLLHSPDGFTWTQANAITSSSVTSLAFGEGRFIFAGEDLISSESGIAWSLLRKTQLAPHVVDHSTLTGLILDKRVLTDKTGVRRVVDVNVRAQDGPAFWAGSNGSLFVERTNLSGFLDMQTTADLHTILTAGQAPSVTYVGGEGGVIRRINISDALTPVATIIPITSPTTNTLRSAISFGTSNRIFVGDGGTILRAVNPGSNTPSFVIEASGTTRNLRAAEYVETKNVFDIPSRDIIVGENGTLLYRASGAAVGTAWTAANTGTTDHLIGVTYVSYNPGNNTGGRYVAVGENGTVIVSQDLITWTPEDPIPGPGKILRLRNGFAVGEYGFYAKLYPTLGGDVYFLTGENNLTAPYAGSPVKNITHGAGRFVAVGDTASAASTNGRNWTPSVMPNTANAVGYGSGKFVTVGAQGNNISTDGISWQPSATFPVNTTLNSIIYGGGTFVASGSQGVIVKSTDGVTWTAPVNILASSAESIVSLAYHNGVFVGVGGGASSSRIISSTDGGATFVDRSFPNINVQLAGVAYGAGRFVAVAPNGYTFSSTDGVGFTRVQVTAAQSSTGATPEFTAIAHANGVFIATTTKGQAYTSADGAAWTQTFTGVSARFTDTTVANGLAVFVGTGKIIGLAVEDKSPYLTSQPQDLTLTQGNTLALAATVSGTAPITCQWLRDGTPVTDGGTVTGATTANLTITSAQPAAAGRYQLIVTNADGSRASREATVTVEPSTSLTFSGWTQSHAFPPGESDPLDDPDGDGLSNLLEYTFGSHPLLAGTAPTLGGQITSGSQLGAGATPSKTYLSFQVRVRKDRPGITLIPQSGTTIAALSEPGASENITPAGPPAEDITDPAFEFITYYHTEAMEDSDEKRAFMRLAVAM